MSVSNRIDVAHLAHAGPIALSETANAPVASAATQQRASSSEPGPSNQTIANRASVKGLFAAAGYGFGAGGMVSGAITALTGLAIGEAGLFFAGAISFMSGMGGAQLSAERVNVCGDTLRKAKETASETYRRATTAVMGSSGVLSAGVGVALTALAIGAGTTVGVACGIAIVAAACVAATTGAALGMRNALRNH